MMENRKSPTPDELPVGLMMRMAQDARAMEGFFSMPYDRQQNMLDFIRSASTGEEAKSRIESAIETLDNAGDFGGMPRGF